MSDGRKYNGCKPGENRGQGRKSKEKEIKLIERLDKHIDSSKPFKTLDKLIDQGNIRAIELYLSYRYGKPRNLELSEVAPMVIRVIREEQLTPIH